MNELAIKLDEGSKKHLYEQIYEYVKQEIKEGKLQAGERLPSSRALAEHLQVSRSTVDLAYEQLVSEGYVESRPYRGFFICKMEGISCLQEKEKPAKEGLGQKEEESSWEYDFSPNGVEIDDFLFRVWRKITKNTLTDDKKEMFDLGNPQGDEGLRASIERYLHASRGVNCAKEQIIIGAGNDYLLLLLEKILGEKRRVAIENPTYKQAFQMFSSFSYEVKTVPMDESGMMVEALEESQADLAYCMPSHQFPTGTVMPIGRRMELLKWAAKKAGRYLIEDDYDSEFRYKGKPIPSLQASDTGGNVIYMGTFSKAIAPAIRVSYMVLPPVLYEKYKNNCRFFSSTVSRLDQEVLHEFIREGYFERHLNRMRKLYKSRHDALLAALKGLGPEFTVSGENAGLHLLLTCHDGRSEKMLIAAAKKAGVRVYGLSDACIGELPETWKPTLLLGYAKLTERELEEGAERLKRVWKKQDAKKK